MSILCYLTASNPQNLYYIKHKGVVCKETRPLSKKRKHVKSQFQLYGEK